MLRRAVLIFSLVFTACSVAVGQPGSPVIVTPGNSLGSIPAAKYPDAQTQPQPDSTPHLKPADLDNRQNLNDGTKMQLIRVMDRSEERRVGKECRSRTAPCRSKKEQT